MQFIQTVYTDQETKHPDNFFAGLFNALGGAWNFLLWQYRKLNVNTITEQQITRHKARSSEFCVRQCFMNWIISAENMTCQKSGTGTAEKAKEAEFSMTCSSHPWQLVCHNVRCQHNPIITRDSSLCVVQYCGNILLRWSNFYGNHFLDPRAGSDIGFCAPGDLPVAKCLVGVHFEKLMSTHAPDATNITPEIFVSVICYETNRLY